MSFLAKITLTSAEIATGPFNIYQQSDSYNQPVNLTTLSPATGITRTDMLSGVLVVLSDSPLTETIEVRSIGTCTNSIFIDVTGIPGPTPTPTTSAPQLTPTSTPPSPTPTATPPSPTPTATNTSTSCILISQTFLLVDNLGCGILDRYVEYTLTYVENGTPTPAPEDITFSVTTQNINNPLDETTYPILLPSGQTTVTDNSVLIRVWDNCEDRISTNYSIESTGLTPSYALCTLTPTPTPTSGSTVYMFYYAQEVDCSNASTTYCSTTSPNGYLIGAPVYSLTQYANITPGSTLLYTDANLTTLLTGSAIDFNSDSIIAISETLLDNTNSGQHKYVKIDNSGEIKTVGVFNCAGSGGNICGGDL